MPKRIKSRVSKKYLYTHVQGITIYNSQKGAKTQKYIKWQMNKQNVLYAYNGKLFRLQKEGWT